MRAKALFSVLLIGLFSVPALSQEFGYPSDGEAWYFIKVQMKETSATRGQNWKVNSVRVNGVRVRDFCVFQRGREIDDGFIDGNRPFELKARYNWRADTDYAFRVELLNEEAENAIELEETARAPRAKGYWNPDWKNYLALTVSEDHGFRRVDYPVHATVGVLSRYFHSPDEIRLIRVDRKGGDVLYTEIPCQVYDIVKWEDASLLQAEEIDEETGQAITRYHPTTTFSVCFQASLKPREKATYLVFYNNPSASPRQVQTDLQVSGKGLGKTIENAYYRVVLDERSGMVTEIVEKKTGVRLEHKLETNGAIHWNPGTYSPPHAWSHASDWVNPAYTEISGPVFYSLHRTAPLPHLQDVLVSIDYTFYRNTPFILMESTLLVTKDLFVKALRNGEVVFNKEVFDHAAYATIGGKPGIIDFARSRRHPEHVITLRPDTPWVAFFSQEKKIAFASLFLDVATSNIYGGGASCQQPYIYIQHGPWYYLSRAFVYSFGSNNQSRMLPVKKGSLYCEKTAWIPFSFRKPGELKNIIESTHAMLRNPLHVADVLETYPESPEGWLVPILTEPFDEGVKGALKGKKKK
ncbi:MAG: hypothetical protein ACE5LV_00635 [Candidatus Aminicenantales bacterium]